MTTLSSTNFFKTGQIDSCYCYQCNEKREMQNSSSSTSVCGITEDACSTLDTTGKLSFDDLNADILVDIAMDAYDSSLNGTNIKKLAESSVTLANFDRSQARSDIMNMINNTLKYHTYEGESIASYITEDTLKSLNDVQLNNLMKKLQKIEKKTTFVDGKTEYGITENDFSTITSFASEAAKYDKLVAALDREIASAKLPDMQKKISEIKNDLTQKKIGVNAAINRMSDLEIDLTEIASPSVSQTTVQSAYSQISEILEADKINTVNIKTLLVSLDGDTIKEVINKYGVSNFINKLNTVAENERQLILESMHVKLLSSYADEELQAIVESGYTSGSYMGYTVSEIKRAANGDNCSSPKLNQIGAICRGYENIKLNSADVSEYEKKQTSSQLINDLKLLLA